MKKKVIILSTALMISLTGVVSAASMWGAYKGNEVIQVKVGGAVIKPSGSPAFNYNGSVMIPLYQLKSFGVEYNYDAASKTVNVRKIDSESLTTKITQLKQYIMLRDKYQAINEFCKQYLSNITFIGELTGAITSSGTIVDKTAFSGKYSNAQFQLNQIKSNYKNLVMLMNVFSKNLPENKDLRLTDINSILDDIESGTKNIEDVLDKAKAAMEDGNSLDPEYSISLRDAFQSYLEAQRDTSDSISALTSFIYSYH